MLVSYARPRKGIPFHPAPSSLTEAHMEARRLPRTSVEHFQLSVRIRHPSMDPAELSHAFKIQPEHCFRAGEPRTSGASRANAAVHTESYWLGVLKPGVQLAELGFFFDHRSHLIAEKQLAATFKSLGFALSLTATRFFSPQAALLRRVRSEGGEVTLLVSIYNPEAVSFTLAPEVSQRLGELGVGVEFELAGS
jgi:hypothetical protein